MQNISSAIRRKILLPLIVVALAISGVFLFAACAGVVTIQDVIDLGYPVTVYYVDDEPNIGDRLHYQRVMVAKESALPTPGKSKDVKMPTKDGCSFKGFYVVETDEEGNNTVTDRLWDFASDKVKDKDVILCAKWWDNFKINLHYGSDYSKVKTVSVTRKVDGEPNDISASDFSEDGYTFISYNSVKNGSTATDIDLDDWKLSADMFDAETREYDLYGKSLDGVWRIIRESKDFDLSSHSETSNYYLMADIDLKDRSYDDEDVQVNTKLPKNYNGKFVGNGHTVSNFEMKLASLDNTYSNFGMFRSLGAGAEITDVTFENVKLSYNISNTSIQHYEIGLLAGQATGAVKVSNVNFSGTFSCMVDEDIDLNMDDVKLIGHEDSSVTVSGSKIVELTKLLPIDLSFNANFTANDVTTSKTCKISVMYSEKDSVRTINSIRSIKYIENMGGKDFEYTLSFDAKKTAENTYTLSVSDNRYAGDLTIVFTPVATEKLFDVSVTGNIGSTK